MQMLHFERKAAPAAPKPRTVPADRNPGERGTKMKRNYQLDDSIRLKIGIDLAAKVGELLLSTNTEDQEILDFAQELSDLVE